MADQMKHFLLTIICSLFCLQLLAERRIVVAQDGSGNYTTLQAAFDAVPLNNNKPLTIFVKKGVYREKLHLDSSKRFVTLLGQDRRSTIITYNDHTGKLAPDGDTINTYTSWTFLEAADDFTASNISFENNAGFNAGQAVAVRITGDRARFFECAFLGFQDVLFPSKPYTRQYFYRCDIEGTTDFIFGPSTAWFRECHIRSKKNSHVTAASTPADVAFGYVFDRCILTADSGVNKVSLGRPWRPYASVTYMRCELFSHIIEEGWNNWKNPANEATARFAEYRNTGPGADTLKRVRWAKQLTDSAAVAITYKTVFKNWDPNKRKRSW